jgi:hypothetical protein
MIAEEMGCITSGKPTNKYIIIIHIHKHLLNLYMVHSRRNDDVLRFNRCPVVRVDRVPRWLITRREGNTFEVLIT